MDKIKLFCLPYAGGSAMIYHRWKPHMPPVITAVPVELAGRGSRAQDELYDCLTAAVDDVFDHIKNDIPNGPYAFYGHSMGALIAFELTRKIEELNLPLPMELFVSGRGALSFSRSTSRKYREMSDEEFKHELRTMGGTPAEFFDHPELMEFFMPVLKSDFELALVDLSDREVIPVSCSISVMIGKEDNIAEEEYLGWSKFTSRQCRLFYFEGDHFFINTQTSEIVNTVAEILTPKYMLSQMT